jgi:hypothetical protein
MCKIWESFYEINSVYCLPVYVSIHYFGTFLGNLRDFLLLFFCELITPSPLIYFLNLF